MICHPAIRYRAMEAYRKAVRITPVGIHPFITETLRSFTRSDQLFNQPWDGIDNDGDGKIDEADEKVTNARGGSSFHNYGLALDFVIVDHGKWPWKVDANWMKVVACFKEQGFTWGGDWSGKFRDAPHFEMRLGFTCQELLARYRAGRVDHENYVLL